MTDPVPGYHGALRLCDAPWCPRLPCGRVIARWRHGQRVPAPPIHACSRHLSWAIRWQTAAGIVDTVPDEIVPEQHHVPAVTVHYLVARPADGRRLRALARRLRETSA